MNIQPVDSYHSPNIPTRDYVDDNPEILNHIPRRWIRNAFVITVLASAVVCLSSCGRRTQGLSASNVFLSEADVRDIMRSEAAKSEVSFSTFENIQKPLTISMKKWTQNNKAKELLRSQVKDFIKWLKTQGVI